MRRYEKKCYAKARKETQTEHRNRAPVPLLCAVVKERGGRNEGLKVVKGSSVRYKIKNGEEKKEIRDIFNKRERIKEKNAKHNG
jgi:hypothetical protein